MTRPPLANSVRCAVDYKGPDGVSATNIFYGMCSHAPTMDDLTLLADSVENGWDSTFRAHMSNGWTIVGATVADNGGTTENVAVSSHNLLGEIIQTALSPNVAVGISWLIPARYRGGHPRTYIPGAPVTVVDAGGGRLLTTTAQGNFQGDASTFLAAINSIVISGGGTFTMGTIAYFRAHAPLVPPVFYPYTSAVVHLRLDSQRRRLGKEPIAL